MYDLLKFSPVRGQKRNWHFLLVEPKPRIGSWWQRPSFDDTRNWSLFRTSALQHLVRSAQKFSANTHQTGSHYYFLKVNRRSNQSILKEINPAYSLERLMLKLQYFGHLMRGASSLEKSLMLGRIEGRRGRGDRGWDGWMASPTQWTWVWANSGG